MFSCFCRPRNPEDTGVGQPTSPASSRSSRERVIKSIVEDKRDRKLESIREDDHGYFATNFEDWEQGHDITEFTEDTTPEDYSSEEEAEDLVETAYRLWHSKGMLHFVPQSIKDEQEFTQFVAAEQGGRAEQEIRRRQEHPKRLPGPSRQPYSAGRAATAPVPPPTPRNQRSTPGSVRGSRYASSKESMARGGGRMSPFTRYLPSKLSWTEFPPEENTYHDYEDNVPISARSIPIQSTNNRQFPVSNQRHERYQDVQSYYRQNTKHSVKASAYGRPSSKRQPGPNGRKTKPGYEEDRCKSPKPPTGTSKLRRFWEDKATAP